MYLQEIKHGGFMKRFEKILAPTDLSENSRRGLHYACSLAADSRASLMVLHIANEFEAWELYSDELSFLVLNGRTWPADRVLAEANLDLNRFLEPHLQSMKTIPWVTKRVLFGPVASRITQVAEEERSDLIVMSPRRLGGVRRLLSASITEKVTRMSPCPVLAVTPPLPSKTWRGKVIPNLLGWPKQTAASV
jgi:nucleotide-binding universal stress UspA family protein